MGGELFVGIRLENGEEHNIITHTNFWPEEFDNLETIDWNNIIKDCALRQLKCAQNSEYGFMFVDTLNKKVVTNNDYFDPQEQHFFSGTVKNKVVLTAWEKRIYNLIDKAKQDKILRIRTFKQEFNQEELNNFIQSLKNQNLEPYVEKSWQEMLDIPVVLPDFAINNNGNTMLFITYNRPGWTVIKDNNLKITKVKKELNWKK